MQVKKILDKDDLLKIAEFFMENNYGNNVHVEIELPDKKTLERVNEDFFYRLNKETDNKEQLETDIDDININVGGVHFKYFVKEK